MRPQVLKQKRLYENQREQLYNQQFNMEQTSFALESIKDTAQTVSAMKAAGAELKSAFRKQDLNIDSIEKLQDEMADLMVRCPLCCCMHVLLVRCHACPIQHASALGPGVICGLAPPCLLLLEAELLCCHCLRQW